METIMHEKYLLILFYSVTKAVKNLAHGIAYGAEKNSLGAKIRTVPTRSRMAELILKFNSDES